MPDPPAAPGDAPRAGRVRRPAAPVLALVMALAACAPVYRDTAAPMPAAEGLDLGRYAGRWYEIARFPVPFQRGCTATTADYALRDDGTLAVTNRCRMGSPDGPVRHISGSARPVGPGALSVRLGWVPVAAPYRVLWVDDVHAMAVVGVPSGRAGWVLARSPEIAPERLAEARAVLRAAGYDTAQLVMTEH